MRKRLAMRKRLIAALATLAALPLAALAAPAQSVTLEVQNMTCPVCPITVKKSLEKVSGVSAVEVDFAQKTATVSFDPEQTRPAALTEATAHAGYPSSVQQ